MWLKRNKDENANPVDDLIETTSANDDSSTDFHNGDIKLKQNVKLELNEYSDKLDSYEANLQSTPNTHLDLSSKGYTIIKLLDQNDEIRLYLAKNMAGQLVIIKAYLHLMDNENSGLLATLPDGVKLLPIIDAFTNDGYYEVLPYVKISHLNIGKVSNTDLKEYIFPSILKVISFLKSNGFFSFILDVNNIYFSAKSKQVIIGDMFDSHHNGILFCEFDNQILHLFPVERKPYISLALSILNNLIKGGIAKYSASELIEKVLTKEIFLKIKNKELANLLYYLLDVKNYSSYDSIIEAYVSSTLADILNDLPSISNQLEFPIKLNSLECKTTDDLLQYIKENFKLFCEYVANGRFEATFVDINAPLLRRFKLLKLGSNSNDEIALRFMQYLDRDSFITLPSCSFDSIESFAKALASGVSDCLRACGNGVLTDALLKSYIVSANEKFLSDIRIVTYFKNDIDLISKYLIVKYANISDKAIIDGSPISDASDVLGALEKCDDITAMADKIISSNAYFPYLMNFLDETSLALARKSDSSTDRLYYLIEALSKSKVSVKNILKRNFPYYLAFNFKRYTYGSRESRSIEARLKAFFKKKIITRDDILELYKIYDQFMGKFQNKVFFDYADEEVQAKKICDYPVIEYEGIIVSTAFLESISYKITADMKKLVYEISSQNARTLVEKTHQSLEEGYNLYHKHFNLLDKYLKIKRMQRISKSFKIFAYICVGLMIICGIAGLVAYKFVKASDFLSKLGFNEYLALYEILLGSVVAYYILFLTPFRIRLKRVLEYKSAVSKLSSSYDLGDNADKYFNLEGLDLPRMYNKNRVMKNRIYYEGSIGISISVFKDMIKSPIRRVKYQPFIRIMEGGYAILCAASFATIIYLLASPLFTNILNITYSDDKIILYSFLSATFLILLSYVRPRTANISRIYFVITIIMTLLLTAICLIL